MRRLVRKKNFLTGEYDYVLESETDRQWRQASEGAVFIGVVLGLLLSAAMWVLIIGLKVLCFFLEKVMDFTEQEKERIEFGFGTLAYLVLAIMAWPFVALIMALPVILVCKRFLDYDTWMAWTAIGMASVTYWFFAFKLLGRKLRKEMALAKEKEAAKA